MGVRLPAVAGRFYPAEPDALARAVDDAVGLPAGGEAPKALIAPHAGYVYSGPIAGSAYRSVAAARGTVARVVIAGPAHFVRLRGLAVPEATAWRTPLGDVAIDAEARAALPAVRADDEPHEPEHAIEVQLPFLQRVLGEVTIVPIAVGRGATDEAAAALDAVWREADTLVVVSSDLSHYHDHETAQRLDARTAEAIVALDPGAVGDGDACGAAAIRGLLAVARRRGMRATCLDLRTSGDTAGDRDRVVGYGAFAFA